MKGNEKEDTKLDQHLNIMHGDSNGENIKNESGKSENSEKRSKILDERMIYETSCIVFSFRHFLWEFIVHLFYPFFCWYAPQAHLFGPLKELSTGPIIFVHFSNILVYVMIISSYMSKKYVNSYTWIAPYMFFVVHRLMVSVKYGCFSNSEYRSNLV